MKDWKDVLSFINEGGAVTRFHSRPGIKPETDAHHMFSVALMCWAILYPEKPSAELLLAALTHDLAEQVASDVSSPAKRLLGISAQLQELEDRELSRYELLFPLIDSEKHVLRLADQLAGMLYCVREQQLGNKGVNLIFDRWISYVEEIGHVGNSAGLLKAIQALYHRAVLGVNFDCFS